MRKFLFTLGALALAGANMMAATPPRHATPGGGTLYGYLGPISDQVPAGLYELSSDGYKLFWRDPLFVDRYDYAMFDDAWYNDGKVCGFALDTYEGNYIYAEVDFESGALLNAKYIQASSIFTLAKYNTDDGYIYGFVSDFNGTYVSWGRTLATDENKRIEVLGRLNSAQRCYSLCYNALEGQFYGVNTQQQFVSINPATGEQTVIATVPRASETDSDYVTALVYSPKDRLYFWNSNLRNYDSFIYTITADGEFDLWQTLDKEEFMYFITTDETSKDPNQPEKPSIEDWNFVNGALTGTITLQMPSSFSDDRPIDSEVSWTLLIDDETYTSGTAATDATVPVNVTVTENGSYKIGAYATVNSVSSFTASKTIYVGNDTPLAPKEVTLSETGITWTAVTAGVHNGYVDVANLTYDVYLNDQLLGNTSSTSYSYDLPSTGEIQPYTATVYAVCNGLKSSATRSNTIAAGGAMSLPIEMLPTADQFEMLTVVDGNNDGTTWTYITTTDEWYGMQIMYSTNGPANDYVFLPKAIFDDVDAFYSFSFDAMAFSPNMTEQVEAVLATSPTAEGVVKTIIPPHTLVRDNVIDWNFTTIEGQFSIDEAGEYYVGVHCISAPNRNGLAIRDLALTNNNIVSSSPGTPVDLVVTPGQMGKLEANVAFNMPTQTFGGETLPADSELTATITNGQFKTTATGKPGNAIAVTIEALQGENTVAITITDANGYNSVTVSENVYCGVSIPADPANFKATSSRDMMSAILSWDAVTSPAVTGAYIDPETITYTIYQGIRGEGYNYFTEYVSGVKGTSYEFVLDEGAEMGEYYFAIEAVNAAGSTGNYENNVASAYLGTPYDLPFYEDFDELNYENTMSTNPWLVYDHSGYTAVFDSWWLGEVSSEFRNDHTVVVAARSNQNEATALMAMPRISTSGLDKATILLDMLVGQGTGKLTLKGEIYGQQELVTIGEVFINEGTQRIETVEISMPESLMDQLWVGIYYEAYLPLATDVVAISIVEITVPEEDGVAGVTAADLSIYGGEGVVNFRNAEGENFSIYTLDGRTVAAGKAAGSNTAVRVAPGIYIATAGSKSAKVVVK